MEKCTFALPRLHGISRRRVSHKTVTQALGSKKDHSAIQGYVQPAAAPNQLLASPWYIKAPLALFGLIAVLRVCKAIANRNRGWVNLTQRHITFPVVDEIKEELLNSTGLKHPYNTCRSLDTLQGRGLISEERSMTNTDPFYDSVLSRAAGRLPVLLST